MLRRVAKLHDRSERRDAVLEVGLRLLQRVQPLVTGEQRAALAAKLRTPHVRISDERAVAAGERVAPPHRGGEGLQRAAPIRKYGQQRHPPAPPPIEGGRPPPAAVPATRHRR